jgi:ParB family chromosome partitioning protein
MNAKKRALGKGLSALLQDSGNEALAQGSGQFSIGNIAEIHLDQIEANPFQPRDHFEEASLEELAASIRQQGIIQPVTVRKTEKDTYQLISGERRLKAARMAGLESIPAFIRTADDSQMLELALVENIQRENLNAIEIGISYQRLLEECQLTQVELSQRIGKSRATVANYIRLLKLPPELQIAIRDNRITMGHARALINIEDQETQLTILKNILLKDLSVREVEAIARNLNKAKNDQPAPLQAIPAGYKKAVKELSKNLGMSVQIRRTADGKGSLSIRFNSDKEFERLNKILNA